MAMLPLASPLVPDRLVAQKLSRFDRIWPPALLGSALIINLVWIGFLGVEICKLIELALF
jgi:hypothetical protein